MNKKLFIMNKKLLMGLGSALILSTPILVATSCGDNGVKVSGYQLIKDETDTNKITIRINGQNLSAKSEDWKITDSNNSDVYNVWTLDDTKSNSNSVYFSATKDNTKGKTYSFSCNGTNMISNFSTPFAPTSISSTEGLKAFKGYQGTNKNPETIDQNKANISINGLTVNFEFKNFSQDSAQFMKLILPSQLGNVFENYQGYNPRISIKWSLKDTNSNFEINNNTLISTNAIDPTTVQNVTLVGSLNMNGWEDTFEIKVNFSNEAQDIQINSVTSKIEQDKVIVTVTGSKLPTESNKWKFKENDNTVSSAWSLSSSPSATETQVTFEATYANVIGKTFTIEGTGVESTASKSFTVPVSTISNINSEMTDDGDLKLTVTGTNLSSTKSLYVFNFVEAAASTYTNTIPSIDVNKINLTWTNSSEIVFTIVKQNDQHELLTKDLYGAKFSLKIKDQTPATEFTFGDYVAPTAIIKDQFFTNVKEGASDSSIATPVNLDKITGANLAYTITTSSADNKFVSISLPKSDDGTTNISSFLSGQKGFTTSGNNTTLTWSIPTDQTNWEYDQASSTLKNKTQLTTDTNPTIAVTGTITDKITSRSKTFTLNLTLVLFNSNSVINDQTISWVSEAGSSDKGKKIKVTFTGSGLSTNQGDWTITAKDSSSSSSTWTIDQASSSPTSVSFTIEYNKDTIGKNYTFSVNGIQGAKDVTIPTSTITSIDSSISTNGDLILKFTGDNLSANLDIYIFTFKPIVNTPPVTTFDGAANNSPATPTTTPPTINEAFKQNINVDWTSKESITLTIQKVRGNGSQDVITKGLYGLWYEVNVINKTEKKQFQFPNYDSPKSIQSLKFFENADSYTQKAEGESQPTDPIHLTPENISQDENKPFEWTITSPSKSHKYIYLVLPSDDEILASIEGWKGFSENLPSSPDAPLARSSENNNTSVSWKFKDGATPEQFEDLSSGGGNSVNVLRNKNDLTESAPISATLTATITDNLTGESVTFDIKITFKLGTLDEPATKGIVALSDSNTKVKVTITGTNLPTEKAKWKIEEINSVDSNQQPKEGRDTSNSNTWTINTSASSTSIEFSANYIDVAGKKYNFSLVDKPEVTTTVTCPAPKFTFTNSKVEGQFVNNYNIEFILSGENLPGDIKMYKFGNVTVDDSQQDGQPKQVILDDLEKSINFVDGKQVKITFNKYKKNQSADSGNKHKNNESADSRTPQTKGLYGKEASIWLSNETENTNKISFPNYYVNGMKKELLGTISTGADSNNLTQKTDLQINIGTFSNKEYPVTITTDSETAKFIKFQLPNNSADLSDSDATGRVERSNFLGSVNFLETGFTSWGGFSSSILTYLKWSLPTQTPPSTDGPESVGGSRESNEDTSIGTSDWKLEGNALTNSKDLTTEGSSVVLTATLTDSETEEKVSFNVKLTVKLGTSSSTGKGSGVTTQEEPNNF